MLIKIALWSCSAGSAGLLDACSLFTNNLSREDQEPQDRRLANDLYRRIDVLEKRAAVGASGLLTRKLAFNFNTSGTGLRILCLLARWAADGVGKAVRGLEKPLSRE